MAAYAQFGVEIGKDIQRSLDLQPHSPIERRLLLLLLLLLLLILLAATGFRWIGLFMGNHCRLATFHEGLAMKNLWGFACGNFFTWPTACINSIKNTEGRRNAKVTIVTNRKSRPQAGYFRTMRYLYSISISGFCLLYCMAYVTRTQ